MKGLIAGCFVLGTLAASAAVIEPGKVEVVVAKHRANGTVAFAVEELTNALDRALGSVPRVRTAPVAEAKPDGVRIFLGEAAGLATDDLPRDAFRIRVSGNEVRIAGRDDLKARMFDRFVESATVHGVYEFLERYFGVRYYFPGELGTIIPRHSRVEIADADFTVKPDYTVRYTSTHDAGALYETCPDGGKRRGKRFAVALQDRRLRMRTMEIPCCHGIAGPHYPTRFAKTHPEYFLLRKDGTRLLEDEPEKPPRCRAPHFCHTSGLWDEIYRDAKSYFSGEGPEVRGVLRGRGEKLTCEWGRWCSDRRYYDVMPNDAFEECRCEKCQAAYDKTKANYATELIWSRTAELARKLTADGLDATITQMAYFPYSDVPKCDLPTNVAVMVARTGPWTVGNPELLEKQNEVIRAWAKKTGGSVWLWTYVGKYGRLDIPDIPLTTPRAFAKYYKMVSPWIFGAYAESKTDRYLYHYLDLYVFSKVCWNLDVDVEDLLAEHDRLMFGPAAQEMGAFFRLIENLWLKVTGNVVVTPLGPLSRPPPGHEFWLKVYNREAMDSLRGNLDRAAALVRPGSLEARRIALIRAEFFEKMDAQSAEYCTMADVPSHKAYNAANRSRLVPLTDFRLYKEGHGTVEKVAENRWRIGPTKVPEDDGYPGARAICRARGLKPGARYRVSYFVRCKDVVSTNKPGNNGGFLTTVTFSDANGGSHNWPARAYFAGTVDWVHHSHEFVADGSGTASVSFRLWAVDSGSAEFEDVTIEEIGQREAGTR